jgi:hypothetical protein
MLYLAAFSDGSAFSDVHRKMTAFHLAIHRAIKEKNGGKVSRWEAKLLRTCAKAYGCARKVDLILSRTGEPSGFLAGLDMFIYKIRLPLHLVPSICCLSCKDYFTNRQTQTCRAVNRRKDLLDNRSPTFRWNWPISVNCLSKEAELRRRWIAPQSTLWIG